MSGSLQHVGDGDARCTICAAMAVGPCARCGSPLCGDCCVIVRGPAKPWAVCPRCAEPSRGLGAAWRGLVGWIVAICLALALATALVGWLASRR